MLQRALPRTSPDLVLPALLSSSIIACQVFNLKFTAKQLSKAANKCEKDEAAEKIKVKKAMEKGNMEGARIYGQNAIRMKTERLNFMKLSSRLDAVVSR